MTLRVDIGVVVGDTAIRCDLAVERGETVALVGPNGAGKSSVLRAIVGLLPAASGSISLDDAVWDDPASGVLVPARDRRVGAVFQDYALFGHMSARDNVAFGLRARGVGRRDADDRALAMLRRLGIADVADRRPSGLSGGQAQRVALGRAIVGEPDVVVLDEPLAALDASSRAAVRRDLPAWLDRGGGDGDGGSRGGDGRGDRRSCRIIVTHDPVDADALADRVVVLERGVVTQRGTVRDLAAAPRSAYVADLMGTNLLRGELTGHRFAADGGGELVVGAHSATDGAVVAAIRPSAIALHRHRPGGTPRNVWQTRIAAIDRSHDRVRVSLGAPLPLVAEITEAGLAALDADVSDVVWASVKASEITIAGP